MNIVNLINTKKNLTIGKAATLEQIKDTEKKLNVQFSKEYVEYTCNLGFAVFEGHELTGVCTGNRLDVMLVTMEERKYNAFVPNGWYVIECLDIDGVVIWQDKNGNIHQTLPNGTKIKLCDSLREYIVI